MMAPLSGTLFGLLISGIFFILLAYRQTKTGWRELMITTRFRLRHLRKLSRDIEAELSEHISRHHNAERQMYPYITYAAMLQQLRADYNELPGEAALVLSSAGMPPFDKSILKKMNRLLKRLLEVRRELRYRSAYPA